MEVLAALNLVICAILASRGHRRATAVTIVGGALVLAVAAMVMLVLVRWPGGAPISRSNRFGLGFAAALAGVGAIEWFVAGVIGAAGGRLLRAGWAARQDRTRPGGASHPRPPPAPP
ncbi:MAG: hypothetical protein JSR86_07050 [Proteobacteria bacterium]|nr:hypothetical protein [Pseudomonadota bacterium]